MKITNTEFLKSAASESGFMTFDKPVIAVCGRSNVGKSSFINMLANRRKLAKTSREPGRTRLVNYFDFGEFVLADLPGYGFAQVSKGEKLKWAATIESFFKDKKYLDHALLLVDIRHDPTADDRDFVNYLNHYVIPFTVVCTKADKLAKTRIKPAAKAVAASLCLGTGNVYPVSNETGYGKDEFLLRLDSVIAAYYSLKSADEADACDEIGGETETIDGE